MSIEHASNLHALLAERMRGQVSETPEMSQRLVDDLTDCFMPKGTKNCKRIGCIRSPCPSRCADSYWMEHGKITRQLMVLLANKINRDEEVYGLVGLIHDIDYLKHPHDRGDKNMAHPIPLVTELVKHDVHPVICMAILEHAPYLRLKNSSRLSHALTACEELATLLSFKENSEKVGMLSKVARGIADAIEVKPSILIDVRVDGEPRVFKSPNDSINRPLQTAIEASDSYFLMSF